MNLIRNRHSEIKKKNKAFFIILIFFTVIAFMLRFFLTRFEIDPSSNLYASSTPLLMFFDYTIAAVIAFIWLSSKFMYREKVRFVDMDNKKITEGEKNIYSESASVLIQGSQTLVFCSSLTGCFLVASAGMQIFNMWGTDLVSYIKDNTFDFILIFAAIFSAIYFFKTAFLKPTDSADTNAAENRMISQKPSQAYLVFSFFPIIWSFFNIFKCFFDMSKSVNSPIRIYELICFLSISLYFVAESRLLLGRRETAKFFSYAYTTILLISLAALPNLILSAFWILDTSTPIIIYAVQLSFLMYILARIYSQIRYGEFILVKEMSIEKSQSKTSKNSGTGEHSSPSQ